MPPMAANSRVSLEPAVSSRAGAPNRLRRAGGVAGAGALLIVAAEDQEGSILRIATRAANPSIGTPPTPKPIATTCASRGVAAPAWSVLQSMSAAIAHMNTANAVNQKMRRLTQPRLIFEQRRNNARGAKGE